MGHHPTTHTYQNLNRTQTQPSVRPSIRRFSVNITYVANYGESGKGVENEDGRTIMDRQINIQPEEY